MKKMYPLVGKHSSWLIIFLIVAFDGAGEVPTNLNFDDEDRSKDENGIENANVVAVNANSLEFSVVVPESDEGLNGLVSTNFDLGHYSHGRSSTDSGDFEIQRRRALANSSGADSFLRAFYQEFGDC